VPFDDRVADANSAVDVLRARSEIDSSRIGLWGFSQGAWIAPMVAAESERIAFLVLVASTGVSPAEQMRYGTVKHARQAGYGDDVARRIVEVRGALEGLQRGRLAREEAQRAIDEAANEPWFEHAYVRRELPEEPGFWPDMDLDPAAVFARVHVPTLLFYGEDDEWQPIAASIAAWRSVGLDDLTIVRLAGTGHSPTIWNGDISPEYERSLLVWLDDRVGSKR
jgi:pimeloyl-ACP methyl ester carboxylesterase